LTRELVFVSAGLRSPKKGNLSIFRRQRYLNYGLLSLANASMVKNGSLVHGHFDAPSATLDKIAQTQGATNVVFLVSCPSFLSLDWAEEFINLASARFAKSTFILGGRWVVDNVSDQIKRRMPRVDFIFEGIGEGEISKFLHDTTGLRYERGDKARSVFEQSGLSFLDYEKLSDPYAFVPSFEGSRGCGAGCVFCAEASVRLTPLKAPATLSDEIALYYRKVPEGVRRFYLETSNFTPRRDWIRSFTSARADRGLAEIAWRTEARVDIFSQPAIEELANAGLKVLDLGLESASHKQLMRMGKTKNPQSYLSRCSQLIRTATENGIAIKLNVLLFPGEDRATVAETVEWLERHKSYFVGVSAFPTIYYGLTPQSDPAVMQYRHLGAELVEPASSFGIRNINLSRDIPYPQSEALARDISRMFMSEEQYFFLKSFSYFDPRYTRHEFRADIAATPHEMLPFSVAA
jgi:radical SAM superfamily enzyme YgiQ (UPF0313 family)